MLDARDGDELTQAVALTELATKLPLPLRRSLRRLGLGSSTLEGIAGAASFAKHAATLRSPSQPPLDRIGAALALAHGLKAFIPRQRLPEFLERAAPELPVARDILRNGTAIADESRSTPDRLGAAVDLVCDLQGLMTYETVAGLLGRFAVALPPAQDLASLIAAVGDEAVEPHEKDRAIRQFATAAEAATGGAWPGLAGRLMRLHTPGEVVRRTLQEHLAPVHAPEQASHGETAAATGGSQGVAAGPSQANPPPRRGLVVAEALGEPRRRREATSWART